MSLPAHASGLRFSRLANTSATDLNSDKSMPKGLQRAMYCRCGNEKILAHGLCSTCYTLKRQDDEYFGGLREAVLQRDG